MEEISFGNKIGEGAMAAIFKAKLRFGFLVKSMFSAGGAQHLLLLSASAAPSRRIRMFQHMTDF
jgi:hypothetical protein